jgi:hypothetical protein
VAWWKKKKKKREIDIKEKGKKSICKKKERRNIKEKSTMQQLQSRY